MPNLITSKKALKVNADYNRACRDLWFLATEVLEYDLLTLEFHKPICEWIVGVDEYKYSRLKGTWDHKLKHPFNFFSAARDHYKTTLQVADIIRWCLRDPNLTHLALHAVDEEVCKLVEEVGQHFIRNRRLRSLLPEAMPTPSDRRFLKANCFTLKRKRFDRQPTLLGKSTGAEITGAHITGTIRPDDIIGRNTIEDSGLPKVKNWWQNTVMPVRRPGCAVVASGTRWDINDIYGEWIASSDWRTWVRAARETDGKPDYKGAPVLYSEKELTLRERQMGPSNFAMQMMNDPSPTGEKPWDQTKCEHFIDFRAAKGPGVVVVLSDPAPAKVGSFAGTGEKKRKDGSKDDWATCVVKVRRNGQRLEVILLDGARSKEWTPDAGIDVICSFLRRYPGSMFMIETYGGLSAYYDDLMRKGCQRNGVPYRAIEFKAAYAARSKNLRFANLAEKASLEEFHISRSVPSDFLEAFLEQAREWRALETGRNSLKYDDCADVVAMSTMEAVLSRAPSVQISDPWEELEEEEASSSSPRSRYCGI